MLQPVPTVPLVVAGTVQADQHGRQGGRCLTVRDAGCTLRVGAALGCSVQAGA